MTKRRDVLGGVPLPGPGEAATERSLPTALRVTGATGTNVAGGEIGTVNVRVEKVDGAGEIDLTAVTADWTVTDASYDLAAHSGTTSAEGYFGIRPARATVADETLSGQNERHELVFDLGDDDTDEDDPQERDGATYFGDPLTQNDVVSLRLRTGGGATTNVRLLVPNYVPQREDGVALTVESVDS